VPERLPRWAAPVTDVAVLVVFVAIGRRTHHDAAGAGSFFRVLWPFAVGLALGYAISGLGRSSLAWRRVVAAWLVTIIVGESLRLGVQNRPWRPAFLAVATVFVGAAMLGWRAALLGVRRVRASRRPT
jgi:hypothetical protein